MKLFHYIVVLITISLMLSACAGGGSTALAQSWPGVTVDAKSETVYVAYGNYLHAINLGSGAEKWRFPKERDAKLSLFAAPALTDDGQLLIGGYNQVFYNLKPDVGEPNWTYEGATDRYVASALVKGESIYAPNADGNLYVMDLSGKPRWQFETQRSIWAAPVANGDKIYLASMDHYLYALDAETGRQAWKADDLGGAIVGRPTLSESGVLYIGTVGSEMVAIDAGDGAVLWRVHTDGWVWSSPLLVDDTLYFGSLGGTFYALNAADGSVRWQVEPDQTAKGQISGAPLLRGDTVYFANKAGVLFAVDAASGSPRWNKTIGGEIYTDLVGTEDKIFIAPVKFDAILVAVNLDGNQIWSFVPPK